MFLESIQNSIQNKFLVCISWFCKQGGGGGLVARLTPLTQTRDLYLFRQSPSASFSSLLFLYCFYIFLFLVFFIFLYIFLNLFIFLFVSKFFLFFLFIFFSQIKSLYRTPTIKKGPCLGPGVEYPLYSMLVLSLSIIVLVYLPSQDMIQINIIGHIKDRCPVFSGFHGEIIPLTLTLY